MRLSGTLRKPAPRAESLAAPPPEEKWRIEDASQRMQGPYHPRFHRDPRRQGRLPAMIRGEICRPLATGSALLRSTAWF